MTAVNPALIRASVVRYLAAITSGDVDAVMALYSDDPTVEDPFGSEPVVGAAAVREFYERACAVPMQAKLTGQVGVTDAAAAFPFQLEVAGGQMTIDVIDVFHFDADGRIAQMRAYWGPTNTR